MRTVRLTTCNTAFEAHLLQNLLENEGIPSITNNEIMNTYPPMSGVDIFVNEDDLEQAVAVIRQNDEPEDCP